MDISAFVADKIKVVDSRCGPFPAALRLLEQGLVVSETNTTKFDTCETPGAIEMITDIDGNLVITEAGWNHPVIVYGASRESIGYDPNKAKKLRDQSIEW